MKFTTKAAIVVTALNLVLIVLILYPYYYPGDCYGPTDVAEASLRRMLTMFMVFKENTGSWPDHSNWKEQMKPYLGHARYLNDAWGNPIKYLVIENNGDEERVLYSFGKNKIDEGGEGDDLKVQVNEFNDYGSNSQ